MRILESAERSGRQGPEAWFTGSVWMEPVVDAAALGEGSRLQGAVVRFSPGARTAWHTHPVGQTLYVISGLGWVQREGERAQAIRPGDVVVIGAGENHWHGAQASDAMAHLAMQEAENRVSVVWGEFVLDDVYLSAGEL